MVMAGNTCGHVEQTIQILGYTMLTVNFVNLAMSLPLMLALIYYSNH
jgi:hypothetical protein